MPEINVVQISGEEKGFRGAYLHWFAFLFTEPFLVVGLIASIRRILVIILEAATLTKEGAWATEGAKGIFHSSMIELGLLVCWFLCW